MRQLKQLVGGAIALIVIGAILFGIYYGAWSVSRWFNWTFGYSTETQAAICEMVKPEALVNPSDCE